MHKTILYKHAHKHTLEFPSILSNPNTTYFKNPSTVFQFPNTQDQFSLSRKNFRFFPSYSSSLPRAKQSSIKNQIHELTFNDLLHFIKAFHVFIIKFWRNHPHLMWISLTTHIHIFSNPAYKTTTTTTTTEKINK